MNGGGDCTTLFMCLVTRNFAFTSGSNDKFYIMYVFKQFFKKEVKMNLNEKLATDFKNLTVPQKKKIYTTTMLER